MGVEEAMRCERSFDKCSSWHPGVKRVFGICSEPPQKASEKLQCFARFAGCLQVGLCDVRRCQIVGWRPREFSGGKIYLGQYCFPHIVLCRSPHSRSRGYGGDI